MLSGVGTQGSGHVEFIKDAFAAQPAQWKLCGWHKNQHLMQIGGKEDETGYDVYDTCRAYGAIVATAHFHSYSRTYTMTNFATQVVANRTEGAVTLAPGQSFAVVSAVGGKDVNDWDKDLAENPWWAAVGANDNDLDDGALFCTFKINGDPTRAQCYFESRRDGGVFDNFTIVNQVPADRVPARVTHADLGCRQPFYEVAVAEGSDDAYYAAQRGGVLLDQTTLVLGGQGATLLRFTGVPLPAEAHVALARVQVRGAPAAAANAAPLHLRVRIELAADAAPLVDTCATNANDAFTIASPAGIDTALQAILSKITALRVNQ